MKLSTSYKMAFAFNALVLFSSPAQAEDQRINFNTVLDAALKNSPEMTDIAVKIAELEAEGISTNTYPNPELSTEVRPYINSPAELENEYQVSLRQPLILSSAGTRSKLKKLFNTSASLEEKILILEFTQSLRLLYANIWALQQKSQFTKSTLELSNSIRSKINKSHQSGLLPLSSVKFLNAQVAKLEAESLGVIADKAKSQALLTQKTGTSFSSKTFSKLDEDPLPPNSQSIAEGTLPYAERIKLADKIANAQLELARRDANPSLAPLLAFEHTDEGDERIIAGLSVTLPFFDRNQSQRLVANALTKSTDKNKKYIQSKYFNDALEQLLLSVKNLHQQSEHYRTKVIPTLNEALSNAEHELELGKAEPSQLLQGLLELMSAQDRYLELKIKAIAERAELSIMLGKEI